jgi:hypothetical protein
LEHGLGFEAVEAEEDVDQADIPKHEILLLFEGIAAVRICPGPMLNGVDLRDKAHGRKTGWAFWVIIALIPIRFTTHLRSFTVVAHGVWIDGMLSRRAPRQGYFVFAERFHGLCVK